MPYSRALFEKYGCSIINFLNSAPWYYSENSLFFSVLYPQGIIWTLIIMHFLNSDPGFYPENSNPRRNTNSL